MTEKVWAYKYQDTTATTEAYDEDIGDDVIFRTAEHHPGWSAPIVYVGDICYIYSDELMSGLELVGENKRLGE